MTCSLPLRRWLEIDWEQAKLSGEHEIGHSLVAAWNSDLANDGWEEVKNADDLLNDFVGGPVKEVGWTIVKQWGPLERFVNAVDGGSPAEVAEFLNPAT